MRAHLEAGDLLNMELAEALGEAKILELTDLDYYMTDTSSIDQFSEAECASGCKIWMECRVALLIALLARADSLVAVALFCAATTDRGDFVFEPPCFGQAEGCRDRSSASFPERHCGVFASMCDAFLFVMLAGTHPFKYSRRSK